MIATVAVFVATAFGADEGDALGVGATEGRAEGAETARDGAGVNATRTPSDVADRPPRASVASVNPAEAIVITTRPMRM